MSASSSRAERLLEMVRGMSESERRAVLANLDISRISPREFALLAAGVDLGMPSYGQERMWLLERMSPGSGYYNVTLALRLEGELDVGALRWALDRLVERHEALRERLVEEDGRPRVEVVEGGGLELEVEEVRGVEGEEVLRELASREGAVVFDLGRGPLVRGRLLVVSEREHVLVLTMHHAVCDGWSLEVMKGELGELYTARVEGREAELGELVVGYREYAAWQRAVLERGMERGLGVWRERLAGAPRVLTLPEDHARPEVLEHVGDSVDVEVPGELVGRLEGLARECGTTLFVVTLAAFEVLLMGCAGVTDVVVGTPSGGRGHPELEGVVGFFVNTLVLRTDLGGEPTFRAVVERTRETVLDAFATPEVPFEVLVRELGVERELNRNPLVQVLFALMEPVGPEVAWAGLECTVLPAGAPRAKVDLEVELERDGGRLTGALTYACELFSRRTVERWAERYVQLLDELAAAPDEPVGRSAAGPIERLNATAVDLPPVPVHELVEAQARLTPDACAVVCGDRVLTYGELERRVSGVAGALRELGVGPEAIVAIHAERSPELVIGILGTLRAGGAYLPLDPDYPPERLRFMLADTRPALVLTQQHLLERVPDADAPVRCLDGADALTGRAPPPAGPGPDALAYVIYTSGSTGRPKGAMNTHGALSNRLQWMQREYRLDAGDAVLQKTPSSFDVSVWELLLPLMAGARLVLAPPGAHRDPEAVARLVADHGVTMLHFVPSMLRVFLDLPGLAGRCASVRHVICSGETLTPELRARFQAALDADLHNLYGPTEAAIDVTHWACPAGAAGASVPIGRPIANVRAHVLDGAMRPLASGVAGELYVGGACVGRGYLGRPDLTAERFVPDPFGPPGARLYRTGDVAVVTPAPALEFLGRRDQQVKVRGVRVEPGEVEAALEEHPAVREAAVVPTTDHAGEVRLVGYVVPGAAAGPLRRLLELEAEGRLEGRERHRMPNGMLVLHHNRGETEFLYQEIFVREEYLRHGVQLRDGACVVDVGANIGLFALLVHRLRRGCRVWAIEPIPATAELLRLNLELHGVDAEVLDCGLSDRAGEATFVHYPNVSIVSGQFADAGRDRATVAAYTRSMVGPDAAGTGLVDDVVAEAMGREERVVRPLRTLSDVVAERGIGRIDLLKVDVERAELAILEGIEERDWPRIRQIVVEVHDVDDRLDRIRALLEERGFATATDRAGDLEATDLHLVFAVRRGAAPAPPAPPPESTWSDPVLLADDLREHLRARLPDAMIPSALVLLPALPLSPSGKLDRAALPAPDVAVATAGGDPRDGLELILLGLWERALGRRPLGIRDGVFDLGGHSLLAAQLVVAIGAALGREVPLSALFRAPTVERLAAALRLEGPGRPAPNPVELAAGRRPALFLLHPAGGHLLAYRGLASELHGDRRVLGLQSPGLEVGALLPDVESMAAAYVGLAREAQPEGPYHLAGWSFGGAVAYEMARRLRADGLPVGALVLIDTYPPEALPAGDQDADLAAFAADLGLPLADPGLLDGGAGVEDALERLLARALRLQRLPARAELDQFRRFWDVYRTNRTALRAYQPPAWAGPLTLIRPEDAAGDDLGWGRLATRLTVHAVPGDHDTLLSPPGVGRCAEIIRSAIDA